VLFTADGAERGVFSMRRRRLDAILLSARATDPQAPQYLWCFNKRGNAGRNILPGTGSRKPRFLAF